MNSNILKTRIQNKIDHLSNWLSSDPIMLNGELGVVLGEISNDIRLKVGNGFEKFSTLPYVDLHLNDENFQTISTMISSLGTSLSNHAIAISGTISSLEESLSGYANLSGNESFSNNISIENDLSIGNDLYVNGQLLSSIISAYAPKIILRQYSEN